MAHFLDNIGATKLQKYDPKKDPAITELWKNIDWRNTASLAPAPKGTVKLKNVAVNKTIDQPIQDWAKYIKKLMLQQGIPEPAASYAVYQCYHETAGFMNNGVRKYTNYSGIMYAGQRGAKKGPNGYAIFDSPQDWARAMAHELTKKSNPAGAASLLEYNNRLKANGYYTANQQQYYNGMARAAEILDRVKLNLETEYGNYEPGTSVEPNQNSGPNYWKWGLIGLGIVIVLKKAGK